MPTTATWRSRWPRPGVVWRFPGRRPRLFDRVVFVLAFLRQPCILVSVLRYLASANSVLSSCCIRALVAPGLQYKACVILFIELCCDYLTVSPWFRSCTLRVWLLYTAWFWGHHKLVSEPTACRTPPSNSLVEVESSNCKTTLLKVSCGLSAHVAKTGWY